MESKKQIAPKTVFLCGLDVINDKCVLDCLKCYECEVITSVDGEELLSANICDLVVVLRDFDNDLFKQLSMNTQSIIGSPALLYNHKNEISLSVISRPVHNCLMKDLVICMSGFHDRDEAEDLLRLLRFMGATCRKDLKHSVTHLVARKASGAKYRNAAHTGVTVMSEQWIKYCWEKRFDSSFVATDPAVISEHILKPFTGLGLVFINCDDTKEMEELTIKNGGEVVSLGNPKCTHIVIDAIPGEENTVDFDINLVNEDTYVVYKEWFWASLEMAARVDEGNSEHAFPIAGSKNFKRLSADFRVACNSSGDLLSPSLDFSRSLNSSDFTFSDASMKNKNETSSTPKLRTKRYAVCFELYETERNYVEVLHTITKIFKEPLEQPVYCDFLLDATEIRIIFGNLTPIYDVHVKILQDLQDLIDNWKESASIGNIYVKHRIHHSSITLKIARKRLLNVFVKYLVTVDVSSFNECYQKCQSKPECKRQSLTELLIRPIQRLPSFTLISCAIFVSKIVNVLSFSDILKNTAKNILDFKQLSLAIEKIKEVLITSFDFFQIRHINEDKRKTEGQIAMFDIINDIEECPPVILSANRHFVCKMDVKLLTKNENFRVIPYKGYTLTLFLFNDVLEVRHKISKFLNICKKRSLKRTHSLTTKGNNKNNVPHSVGSSSKQTCKKSYRHMESLHLESVKNIFHFSDCEGYEKAFLLVTNVTNSRTFSSYPFIVDDKDIDLQDFLKLMITQVRRNGTNDEYFQQKGNLDCLNAVDFEHAEELAGTLTKSKTKQRISRAFSMKRPPLSAAVSTASLYTPPPLTNHRCSPSPSPRRIGRTLSQLLNQFSSNSPLQRRQMSTTSLTELPDENAENTFSLPTTPAPRKKKCQNGDTSEYLGDI
ncbi:protein ECT2-like protein [Leptotrombidium deliense]|uniref:Protein ECT2-like protein n=1 Tax=Leptotrombidium deliense TaxID=299467 RepID=A0A443SVL1_9ACAR|nr:protein ECT2-like protein [Leptotrombidium deliense]